MEREPKVEIDEIGGNCPVQAFGRIGDEKFYFRARGRTWTLCVGDDPVTDARWIYEEYYGDGSFDAGWMSEDEARTFITYAAKLLPKEDA
jgi:hypothetical protein